MTVLLKAADLVKRPVVTLAGENIAQIRTSSTPRRPVNCPASR